MTELAKLIDLDTNFYRNTNFEISKYSDQQLVDHYYAYGYWQGRWANKLAIRENFLASIFETSGAKILEIGPYYRPSLWGDNVEYIDIMDKQKLQERAISQGSDPSTVPDIKFVSKDGTLKCVNEKFDILFSSHNIEHQPDLISHLNEAGEKLNDGGVYALIVPNARYCFDAQLPLSKISEVFNANIEKRKVHTLGSVIEHRALTTHNDSAAHWAANANGSNKDKYYPIDPARVAAAVQEYVDAKGGYVDVHAWQFDPLSLSDILNTLIELGRIPFSRVECNGQANGRLEFTLKLFK